MSIADTKIWAVALSTGNAAINVDDSTNVIIRIDKVDGSANLEFYRVDFKGKEAGSVGSR